MPFLLLVVLALTCLQHDWPRPPDWLGAAGSALLTWATALAAVGAATGITRRLGRRLQSEPGQLPALLRRYRRARRLHLAGLLGGYAAVLLAGGWGWTARALGTLGDGLIPGVELLVLAPFLAGLILSWSQFYD